MSPRVSTSAEVRDAMLAGYEQLKSTLKQSVDAKDLLHPAVGKLAQYDTSNRSELLRTLQVYLDNDCNAQRCANLLFLHRNSLQYRVRRIQEVGGVDLSDPEERAYLRLSLLLK